MLLEYGLFGYGHTRGVKPGQKITQEQAEDLLRKDLYLYERVVQNCVREKLTDNQFAALVSFTYNLGPEALERSTLLRKINAKKFDEAANEFQKWNTAKGKVLEGLTRRRLAEAELFSREEKQDVS